jgi:hypothetical protein
MQIWTLFIDAEKFEYKMANFKPYLAYDALQDLATLHWLSQLIRHRADPSKPACPPYPIALAASQPVVLLRIPDFRDRDFRIFKPILKKGFESDPDL